MENKFLNETYSGLYNLEFSYFVDSIVKHRGEDLLNECNLKISDFVFKYADDFMVDLNGIHRFIEGITEAVFIKASFEVFLNTMKERMGIN